MEGKDLRMMFMRILPPVNFMTPYVEGYFEKGEYLIELSTGGYSSVLCCYIFGVTVVNTKTRIHCIDLCKSFVGRTERGTREEAMEYIESF